MEGGRRRSISTNSFFISSLCLGVVLFQTPVSIAAVLTADNCASFNQEQVNQPTEEAHAFAAEYLLQQGRFTRVVDGYARLNTGAGVGNISGGGTNTNGAYFTYALNASSLPDGICENIPNHSGDYLCPSSAVFPDGETMNFMLAPSDAIVFYGCTPPPVDYFGYDFIITTRFTETYPWYPGTNFQDVMSWRDINVTSDDGSSTASTIPSPFDRPALFIHTPDSESATIISDAYQSQAGISSDSVSVHRLNSDELKLLDRNAGWQQSKADLIGFIHRITLAQDGYEDDFNAFLNMTFPVKFYIAADDAAPGPLFDPELRSRETGGSSGSTGLPTETELLEDALHDLTDAIQSKYNPNTTTMTGLGVLNFTEIDAYDNWDEFLASPPNNNTFVAGTRDATYGQSMNLSMAMLLRNTSASVLVGAIHTATGKSNVASYFEVGLDVTNLDGLAEFAEHPLFLVTATRQSTWLDQKQLQGSAARYLPADYDPDLSEKLFAVDFFPEGYCSEPEYASPWCFEYSSKAINPKLPNPTGIPATIVPETGERIYSVAATHTGPSEYETLPSRLLTFDFAGPCENQYSGFRCRSDGVIGYSLPCDTKCDETSCQYTLWEDSEPYGYLLDGVLECTAGDGDATQISCNGDVLTITVYDSCKNKNCQFLEYPVSSSVYDETNSLDDNKLCIFIGTVDECEAASDLTFKVRPCGQSTGEPDPVDSRTTEQIFVEKMAKLKSGKSHQHAMIADKFKVLGKQIQVELEKSFFAK